MTYDERVKNVNNCKYVDDILYNVPWVITEKFMDDNKRLPKESTDKDEANLRIWLRSNIEIYEKNKFEGYPDKLKEFEKILPTINSYMNTLTNHEIWINNLKSLESYYLKFKKLPPEKFKVNPSATGKDLEEQESFKALGTWKSNLIQDIKKQFNIFCMDIDVSKLSETEKKKILTRQQKFEEETLKFNSILEQNYSKLNKTQMKAYDKAKDDFEKRTLNIETMRSESKEKINLFTSFNNKYHLF
jgi:hypothetical protein